MIDHKFSQRPSIAKVCPLHVTYMNPQALALEHRHDFLELVIILKGEGEQYGGLYKGEVRAGDVFLIPCGVSHGYRDGSPDFSLIKLFREHSWYFRNALVRANYRNVRKGIEPDPEFLERFFRNLLAGEQNELKNRFMLIDPPEQLADKHPTSTRQVDPCQRICLQPRPCHR